jgi:hypothetical protein
MFNVNNGAAVPVGVNEAQPKQYSRPPQAAQAPPAQIQVAPVTRTPAAAPQSDAFGVRMFNVAGPTAVPSDRDDRVQSAAPQPSPVPAPIPAETPLLKQSAPNQSPASAATPRKSQRLSAVFTDLRAKERAKAAVHGIGKVRLCQTICNDMLFAYLVQHILIR